MFLGIDGGGSKTTAVLVRENGEFVAQTVVGSINYYSNPLSEARGHLAQIVQDFQPFLTDGALRAAFIGMSALNDRADDETLHRFVDGVLPTECVAMDSDLYIALETMCTDGACAVAICGTGSMIVGRTADGTLLHRGGYGYLLGDEGSGYAIALDAVRAAVRAAEHSAPDTMLTAAALEHFQAPDVDALIPRFYDPPIRRQDVAAFLPSVCRCAERGDAVAAQILRRQADAFADTANALLRELPDGTPLGLWGGVFLHVPLFARQFAQRVPNPIRVLPFPPQFGAVFAAWKLCGVAPTAARLDTLSATFRKEGA